MKTSTMSDPCSNKQTDEQEKWLLEADGFIWDLVVQLHQLREQRGLSQAELAEVVGTHQQVTSRLENPGYDKHSLSMVRRIAEKLGAMVDVTLVPIEKAEEYLEWRYQPVLMETPPANQDRNEHAVSVHSDSSKHFTEFLQSFQPITEFSGFEPANWLTVTTNVWANDQRSQPASYSIVCEDESDVAVCAGVAA